LFEFDLQPLETLVQARRQQPWICHFANRLAFLGWSKFVKFDLWFFFFECSTCWQLWYRQGVNNHEASVLSHWLDRSTPTYMLEIYPQAQSQSFFFRIEMQSWLDFSRGNENRPIII
jgi:hypothetical protein